MYQLLGSSISFLIEFELYLVKPGQDRVVLDLTKCLSDYGTIQDHVS